MRGLDDPAPGLAVTMPLGLGLLAARAQMQGEPEFSRQSSWIGIVVALVQAQVLFAATGRPGALYAHRVQRVTHEQVIVAVGARDGHADRCAPSVGQHRALHAPLAPVGRVGAGFFPHRAELSPSHRPTTTRSSRCPSQHRRPEGLRARIPRRPRPPPTPGNDDAPTTTSRSRCRSRHSIGNRCVEQRRSRPWPSGLEREGGGTPGGAWAGAAAVLPSAPTTSPAIESRHQPNPTVDEGVRMSMSSNPYRVMLDPYRDRS